MITKFVDYLCIDCCVILIVLCVFKNHFEVGHICFNKLKTQTLITTSNNMMNNKQGNKLQKFIE